MDMAAVNLLEKTTIKKTKMNIMKLFTTILLSFLLSTFVHAQVSKIEHFFVSSPQAEKLFQIFSNELQLPVLWKYQSWGDFASGGVTLGNVAFEFVNYKGADSTSFNGIALEPVDSMEELEKEFDKLGIAHDTIDNSNVSKDSTGKITGWSLFTPKDVLPFEANLFVCDYKERQRVADNRKKGADKLKEMNGGGLGVVLLKEIVIGVTDMNKYAQQLQKFPDIKRSGNQFFFKDGPALHLQMAAKNGTIKIVIIVNSLQTARSFLEAKKMLGKVRNGSIFISPAAIDGLQIELVER